jgi:hypothetical protein
MCHQIFGRTCFSIFRVEDLTEDGGNSFLQKLHKRFLFSKASHSLRRFYVLFVFISRILCFVEHASRYNRVKEKPM